ncbi:dolichyl-P-Man:Man(7)GlcNAc(2)-PP-dolichol alpha-1,6-mannosyltransferase [Tulasnella sp. JGI-2019a]|nr:dolichyl-P-Man:Man(7)GlcNAc(2)-PP-dolichol alpha-1,6-mannosyltransferase [Tulasnella sp. JGI-2019a]
MGTVGASTTDTQPTTTRMFNPLDVLLFVIPFLHVYLAPFTKVEESFNLHATHDVLMYGILPGNLYKYDHFIFPGAVPRSFIGSVLLAWTAIPLFHMAETFGIFYSKMEMQIIVRMILAAFNAVGLLCIRKAATRRFGLSAGNFFTLLTVTQFHVPFWMGRTLPNMFAFALVNIATSLMLMSRKGVLSPRRRWFVAISLIGASAIVFRAELVMYCAPVMLHGLLARKLRFRDAITAVLAVGTAAIACTVLVDSYFWQQFPLWPEAATIYFNIYQGKSSDWGISPFHTYFTAFLPKMLHTALPLAGFAILVDPTVGSLLLAPLFFIASLSFIGHKEWRFVVYVAPIFNVVAARGASWIYTRRRHSFFHRILMLGVLSAISLNILHASILTLVSTSNYPGGAALAKLNLNFDSVSHANVYMDDFSAQSGASLFLQAYAPPYTFLKAPSQSWTYDKTAHQTDFSNFTFVLTEDRGTHLEGWCATDSVIRGRTRGKVDYLWIMQKEPPEGAICL